MDVLINPGTELPDFITELTGVTDEMLADAPHEQDAIHDIVSFMGDADVWAGYNVNFDLEFFRNMADRCKTTLKEKPCLDVLQLARGILKYKEVPNYKLATVTSHLLPDYETQFHSAINDVYATALVMQKLLRMRRDANKRRVVLKGAKLFVNRYKPSQIRLNMILEEGEEGDIFYVVNDRVVLQNGTVGRIQGQWGHKCTKQAEALYAGIDIEDLERQVLGKYGHHGYTSVADIARSWLAFSKDVRAKRNAKQIS